MHDRVAFLILAAGLGTRMKSRKAKVLHRAGGVPLIEHVVKATLDLAPPDRVTAVVGHQAGEVQAALSRYGVGFALQREQKGTGHAVQCAREALAGHDGLLVVLYGDCPLLSASTLGALIETQRGADTAATVITTELDDPTGYGRVIADEQGRLLAIVEQKSATPEQLRIREINSGIYCFQAELLWPRLDEIRDDNPAGEYYLTDVVEIFRRHGLSIGAYRLKDPTEVLGINTRVELAAVDKLLRDRKTRQLMLDGVSIERPETVTVDAGVRIGMDTTIGPFAQILGETVIGEECRIGAAAIVENSVLGDRVEVGPFTLVNDSRVDAGGRVGPFARLRFGNHVEAGAAVGNFVELKKTRLGAGAKALHLAYLGDAVIEPDANIGAGTITCNYDGVTKHQTRVGRGAFVGSNSTLVAPLEIGAGSYVAAGSVITDSVPADALALGRERQVVKPDWARRRREKTSR
ncbi:MAG: bifunctional UDP-N-acetylglucosamine diphosphorylase/glucosamine-1-phosphate N-acetyltransferase GlmU [Bryobacteraceae bacterium]|nr:bifunctional UDP-N-acetylglucosamine diphosphorylase/glucosamine-1-phosphate N-acetyltransferase GlmU [Bryobacteraceae bacterium]